MTWELVTLRVFFLKKDPILINLNKHMLRIMIFKVQTYMNMDALWILYHILFFQNQTQITTKYSFKDLLFSINLLIKSKVLIL